MDGYAGIAECRDCGTYVLRYRDAGVLYDIASKPIPPNEATVLHHYGHLVVILRRLPEQLRTGGWVVGTYVTGCAPEGATLHAGHRCTALYEKRR